MTSTPQSFPPPLLSSTPQRVSVVGVCPTATVRTPFCVPAESTVPGGPIGGQTRVTLRNEHLQYIITW